MSLVYRNAGLGGVNSPDLLLVRALQTDLRVLGYLKRNIDGQFGNLTRLAVRRLQFDLLQNQGKSSAGDGSAPVAISDYNRGVSSVTGIVDIGLADSIEALLDEPRIPPLPRSADPKSANRAAIARVAGTATRMDDREWGQGGDR